MGLTCPQAIRSPLSAYRRFPATGVGCRPKRRSARDRFLAPIMQIGRHHLAKSVDISEHYEGLPQVPGQLMTPFSGGGVALARWGMAMRERRGSGEVARSAPRRAQRETATIAAASSTI